jgi:hypothetical protein
MIMKIIYALIFLLCANTAFAQSRNSDYERVEIKEETLDFSFVKNAGEGYSYAQCQIADEYETLTDYNWRTRPPDTIFHTKHRIGIKLMIPEIKPEQIEQHRVKLYDAYPVYFLKGSSVNHKKAIRKKTKNGVITLLPPIYKVHGKRVDVHRDSIYKMVWQQGQGDNHCLSAQYAKECVEVVCGAVNTLKVLVFEKQLKIPPRYITAAHDTIRLPFNSPFLDSIIVPARFVDFQYNHLNSKDLVYRKYDTITTTISITQDSIRKVRVRKGRLSEWQPVLCSSSPSRHCFVADVQTALFFAGCYWGKIDNIMGSETKKALVLFQKENGLPIGTINLQTLKALEYDGWEGFYGNQKYRSSILANPFYPNNSDLIAPNMQEFRNMGFSTKELRKQFSGNTLYGF